MPERYVLNRDQRRRLLRQQQQHWNRVLRRRLRYQRRRQQLDLQPNVETPRNRTAMLAIQGHPLREDETDCTICFDPLLDSQGTVTHDLCTHSFHRECMQTWVQQLMPNTPTCPMCRNKFSWLEPVVVLLCQTRSRQS